LSELVVDASVALAWCFPHDAAYLELAIRYGAPLATLDSALQKAAQRAGVRLFP
jgi:rRNA-processing protein FCF1